MALQVGRRPLAALGAAAPASGSGWAKGSNRRASPGSMVPLPLSQSGPTTTINHEQSIPRGRLASSLSSLALALALAPSLSLSRTRALSPSLSLAGESLKFRETNLNGIECHQKRRARTNHAHANLGSSTKNAVAEASAILTSPAARRATRAATPRRTVRPRDGSSSPLVTSIGTTPCFARAS